MKTFSDMQGLTTFMFHTLVLRKLLTDVFHQNKGINLGIQVKKKMKKIPGMMVKEMWVTTLS